MVDASSRTVRAQNYYISATGRSCYSWAADDTQPYYVVVVVNVRHQITCAVLQLRLWQPACEVQWVAWMHTTYSTRQGRANMEKNENVNG